MKFSGSMLVVLALFSSLISLSAAAGVDRSLYVPHRASAGAEQPGERLGFLRVQKKGGISRDQAATLVKRKYGGKILAIQEVERGGRSVYRVKGLSDKSQVYVVFVDKQSGRISR